MNILLKRKYPILALAIVIAIWFGMRFELYQNTNIKFSKESMVWSDVNKITTQKKVEMILRLLKTNFEGDVIIVKYDDGPSGSLIAIADIDGQLRQFILLADKETFVEGVVYSPFMSNKQISSQHSRKSVAIAETNQLTIDHRESIKSGFVQRQASSIDDKPIIPGIPKILPKQLLKLPEVNSIRTAKSKMELFEATKKLEFVEFGNDSAPVIYVYFDYNCGGCRQVKKILKKHIDNGDVNVRYIPVATQNEDSYIKAAYSLIPDLNEDRKTVFEYFAKKGTAAQLISKKAPRLEFNKAIKYVKKSNETFILLPNKVTPTFVFEHKGETFTASTTSSSKIIDLIKLVNK